MTIQTNTVSTGLINASPDNKYILNWRVEQEDNLKVYKIVNFNKVRLQANADYVIESFSNDNTNILVTNTIDNPQQYIFESNFSYENFIDFFSDGTFKQTYHEQAFDKITMLCQQINKKIEDAVITNQSLLAYFEENKAIKFKNNTMIPSNLNFNTINDTLLSVENNKISITNDKTDIENIKGQIDSIFTDIVKIKDDTAALEALASKYYDNGNEPVTTNPLLYSATTYANVASKLFFVTEQYLFNKDEKEQAFQQIKLRYENCEIFFILNITFLIKRGYFNGTSDRKHITINFYTSSGYNLYTGTLEFNRFYDGASVQNAGYIPVYSKNFIWSQSKNDVNTFLADSTGFKIEIIPVDDELSDHIANFYAYANLIIIPEGD